MRRGKVRTAGTGVQVRKENVAYSDAGRVRNGAACSASGVRKPPRVETALRERKAVPRAKLLMNERRIASNADRGRRLSLRLLARAHPARRNRRERTSHHGLEKRTAAHACRRFRRKNGGFWRARFCTEVRRDPAHLPRRHAVAPRTCGQGDLRPDCSAVSRW
jgi:hypothetical protein